MSIRHSKLSNDEIQFAFCGKHGDEFPVILSPAKFARLLGLSRKTIDDWMGRGRLDGSYRRRGKHVLIWRNRALDILFNGKEWGQQGERK